MGIMGTNSLPIQFPLNPPKFGKIKNGLREKGIELKFHSFPSY